MANHCNRRCCVCMLAGGMEEFPSAINAVGLRLQILSSEVMS